MTTARVLFDEARRLLKAGQYAIACGKLQAASAIYAGSGVLLNLGDCYEKSGRTASAYAAFARAAATAAVAGRDEDQAEAQRRRMALEPKLSRLAIHVSKPTADLRITLNGKIVPSERWEVAVPVDPGPYRVEAERSSRRLWSVSLVIAPLGETVTIAVPETRDGCLPEPHAADSGVATLAPSQELPDERAPSVQPASGVRRRGLDSRRTAAVVMGSAGAASIVTSAVLLFAAEARFAQAQGLSGGPRAESSERAVALGDGASVAFAIGMAMVAGGGVLWLSGTKPWPTLGTDGRHVFLGSSF